MVQPSQSKKKKGKKKRDKKKKSKNVTVKASSDSGKKKSDNKEKKQPSSSSKASEKKEQEKRQEPSNITSSTGNKKDSVPPLPNTKKAQKGVELKASSGVKASGNVLEPSSTKSKSDKKPDKAAKPSSGKKASDNASHPAPSGNKEADKATQRSSSEKKNKKLDTTIQASSSIVLTHTESLGSELGSTEPSRKLIKRHKSLELKPNALAIRANGRPLLRSGESKNLIGFRKSEAISTSFISARLSMVQVLSKGLCFLKLDVQSIRSPHTRIDAMNIRWQFARSMRNFGSMSPIVKEVAPKQSIGARDEENRQSQYGLEVPVQASQMGVTVGPKFSADFSADRKVARGMVITGFIQGDEEAGWRIKENSGAMSGVPSHFCVGVVIQYSGVIAMELELHATQRVEFSMGLSLRSQPLHARMAIELDVDSLQHDFEPENPPDTWREWFTKITGDVEGYNLSHSQVALTS